MCLCVCLSLVCMLSFPFFTAFARFGPEEVGHHDTAMRLFLTPALFVEGKKAGIANGAEQCVRDEMKLASGLLEDRKPREGGPQKE